MIKKYLAPIILTVLSFALITKGAELPVLKGPQGGTNVSSTTAGDIGKFLRVKSVNPLVWDLGAGGSGVTSLGDLTGPDISIVGTGCVTISTSTSPDVITISCSGVGGTGSVTTSSDITQFDYPYWANVTGGLSGTSTLKFTPTKLLVSTAFNASGTITQNGVPVLTTSTGLTVSNFANQGNAQWTNDANYLTSLSGALLIANNLSDLSSTSSARTNIGFSAGSNLTLSSLGVFAVTSTPSFTTLTVSGTSTLSSLGDCNSSTQGVQSTGGILSCGTIAGTGGTNFWARTSPFVYLATSTDSVGIGNSTPSSTLHVSGTSRIQAVTNGTSTFTVKTNTGTSTLSVDTATSSTYIFEVQKSDGTSQFGVATTTGQISFRGIQYVFPSSQGGASTVLSNDGSGNLSWGAGGGSSVGWSRTDPNVYLSTSTDKVGVGTAQPSSTLHVVSNVTSTDIFRISSSSGQNFLAASASGTVTIGTGSATSTATFGAAGKGFCEKKYGFNADGVTPTSTPTYIWIQNHQPMYSSTSSPCGAF